MYVCMYVCVYEHTLLRGENVQRHSRWAPSDGGEEETRLLLSPRGTHNTHTPHLLFSFVDHRGQCMHCYKGVGGGALQTQV